MDTTISASQRLRILRGNISQTEFARKLNIHKNTLGRYERGISEPDLGFARDACTIFGVEPRWLLFGEGPMLCSGSAAAGQTAGALGDEPGTLRREAGGPPRDDEGLRREALDLLQENKELRRENRELNRLVRRLLEENGDLRVAVAENKAGSPGGRRN